MLRRARPRAALIPDAGNAAGTTHAMTAASRTSRAWIAGDLSPHRMDGLETLKARAAAQDTRLASTITVRLPCALSKPHGRVLPLRRRTLAPQGPFATRSERRHRRSASPTRRDR